MHTITSINPANQSVIGEIPCSTREDILNKVALAQAAKTHWKELGIENRIAILRPLIEKFKQRENDILKFTVQEMGKTITEAKSDLIWDFDYFHEFLKYGPDYIKDEITVSDGKILHRIIYEPRGVVACIVPWNFPFANFVWGVIPNLIVGNTVIFKHSEECPLLGKVIEEVMQSLPDLPKGVFAEIYGGKNEGLMLAQSQIDMIWFTGSSAVGSKLYEVAGNKMIKAVLEMGGSNPAIVFDDVNIDDVIPRIYRGRFTNCGQVCDAVKRVIVHHTIYEKFIAKFSQYLQTIKIGDPEHPETELGPLAAMRQLHLLEAQVQDSINMGANILVGGKRPENLQGAYYLPTLLTNIHSDMRVWKEEIFGPVLPIVPFTTEEEAIALANDSIYGLGAAVHTNDLAKARRVAQKIDAGFVDINEGNHWRQCNPFGGYKFSGMGCEHGHLGFRDLCQYKVVAEG